MQPTVWPAGPPRGPHTPEGETCHPPYYPNRARKTEPGFKVIRDYLTALQNTRRWPTATSTSRDSPRVLIPVPQLSDIRAEANNRCEGTVTEEWVKHEPGKNGRLGYWDNGHFYRIDGWKLMAVCDDPSFRFAICLTNNNGRAWHTIGNSHFAPCDTRSDREIANQPPHWVWPNNFSLAPPQTPVDPPPPPPPTTRRPPTTPEPEEPEPDPEEPEPTAMSTRAWLEVPADGSFQSGIGFISGWACEGERIQIIMNGGLHLPPVARGIGRGDTEAVCGDRDNGFILHWNWNLLGEGRHTAELVVDGRTIRSTTFTITTLGEEFVRGAAGECSIPDFPSVGETARFLWQEPVQGLVLVPGSTD